MTSIKNIIGHKLSGGEYTRRLFTKLLGLENTHFKIKTVAWVYERVEILIEIGKGREAILSFKKFQTLEDTESFLHTNYLSICSRGDPLPDALITTLNDNFIKKWNHLTIEKIAELICNDKELGKVDSPLPTPIDTLEEVYHQLDSWGAGDSYADFFAKGEFERSQLDSIEQYKYTVTIQHCDLECNNIKLNEIGRIIIPVNFPWSNRIKEINVITQKDKRNEDIDERFLTTDLTEKDVILGTSLTKAKEVLEYITSKQSSKRIFFSNTCVPEIIGDDVESLVKHYQKYYTCPLLFLTVSAGSMHNVFKEILTIRRMKAEENMTISPDNKKINLIGFQLDRYLNELIIMLREIGIETNAILLPNLALEDIDKLPQAPLNVFLRNNLWQHLYEQLLFNTKLKYIFPEGPYGISKTKKWLEEIVSTLGVDKNRLEIVWQKYFDKVKNTWEELTNETKKFRVGIVVRASQLHHLTDSANTWGIPIIDVLEEMGFGIDILIGVIDKRNKYDTLNFVKKLRSNSSKPNYKFFIFNDFESMHNKLLESSSNIVFSNFFFDWRITEVGKVPFSLQYFGKGITGAIETVEKLLQLCNMKFYSQYFKYLRRDSMGLLPQY